MAEPEPPPPPPPSPPPPPQRSERTEQKTINTRKNRLIKRLGRELTDEELHSVEQEPIRKYNDKTNWTTGQRAVHKKSSDKDRQQKLRDRKKTDRGNNSSRSHNINVPPKSAPRPVLQEQPSSNRGVHRQSSSTGVRRQSSSTGRRRSHCEPTMEAGQDDNGTFDPHWVPPQIRRVHHGHDIFTAEPDENQQQQQQQQQNRRFSSSAPSRNMDQHFRHDESLYNDDEDNDEDHPVEPDGTDVEEFFDAAEDENEYDDDNNAAQQHPHREHQQQPSNSGRAQHHQQQQPSKHHSGRRAQHQQQASKHHSGRTQQQQQQQPSKTSGRTQQQQQQQQPSASYSAQQQPRRAQQQPSCSGRAHQHNKHTALRSGRGPHPNQQPTTASRSRRAPESAPRSRRAPQYSQTADRAHNLQRSASASHIMQNQASSRRNLDPDFARTDPTPPPPPPVQTPQQQFQSVQTPNTPIQDDEEERPPQTGSDRVLEYLQERMKDCCRVLLDREASEEEKKLARKLMEETKQQIEKTEQMIKDHNEQRQQRFIIRQASSVARSVAKSNDSASQNFTTTISSFLPQPQPQLTAQQQHLLSTHNSGTPYHHHQQSLSQQQQQWQQQPAYSHQTVPENEPVDNSSWEGYSDGADQNGDHNYAGVDDPTGLPENHGPVRQCVRQCGGSGGGGSDGDDDDDDDDSNSDFGGSVPFQEDNSCGGGGGDDDDSGGDEHKSAFATGSADHVRYDSDEGDEKEPHRPVTLKSSTTTTQASTTDGEPSVDDLRPAAAVTKTSTNNGEPTIQSTNVSSWKPMKGELVEIVAVDENGVPHENFGRVGKFHQMKGCWFQVKDQVAGRPKLASFRKNTLHKSVAPPRRGGPPSSETGSAAEKEGSDASLDLDSDAKPAAPPPSVATIAVNEKESGSSSGSDVESVAEEETKTVAVDEKESEASSDSDMESVAEEESVTVPEKESGSSSGSDVESVAEEETATVPEKESGSSSSSDATVDEVKSNEDADDVPALVQYPCVSVAEEETTSAESDDDSEAWYAQFAHLFDEEVAPKDGYNIRALATVVKQQHKKLEFCGAIKESDLEMAQGMGSKSYDGCNMITVKAVQTFLEDPTGGPIDNPAMTRIIKEAGRLLEKKRAEDEERKRERERQRERQHERQPQPQLQPTGDSDTEAGDSNTEGQDLKLMSIETARLLLIKYTGITEDMFKPYDDNRGGNICCRTHLDNVFNFFVEHNDVPLGVIVYFKAHYLTIVKFRVNATTFAYDLLETLPKQDGTQVGTRIHCKSLNALKVALLHYAFGRMTTEHFRSIQNTTWDNIFLGAPANSSADPRIFQTSFWVWEKKND